MLFSLFGVKREIRKEKEKFVHSIKVVSCVVLSLSVLSGLNMVASSWLVRCAPSVSILNGLMMVSVSNRLSSGMHPPTRDSRKPPH